MKKDTVLRPSERIKALEDERDALIVMLEGIQWSKWSFHSEEHVCPVCENFHAGIHESDCELGKAVKRLFDKTGKRRVPFSKDVSPQPPEKEETESTLVDMIDDQPIKRVPKYCHYYECGKINSKIIKKGDWYVCENCGVSYGAVKPVTPEEK